MTKSPSVGAGTAAAVAPAALWRARPSVSGAALRRPKPKLGASSSERRPARTRIDVAATAASRHNTEPSSNRFIASGFRRLTEGLISVRLRLWQGIAGLLVAGLMVAATGPAP